MSCIKWAVPLVYFVVLGNAFGMRGTGIEDAELRRRQSPDFTNHTCLEDYILESFQLYSDDSYPFCSSYINLPAYTSTAAADAKTTITSISTKVETVVDTIIVPAATSYVTITVANARLMLQKRQATVTPLSDITSSCLSGQNATLISKVSSACTCLSLSDISYVTATSTSTRTIRGEEDDYRIVPSTIFTGTTTSTITLEASSPANTSITSDSTVQTGSLELVSSSTSSAAATALSVTSASSALSDSTSADSTLSGLTSAGSDFSGSLPTPSSSDESSLSSISTPIISPPSASIILRSSDFASITPIIETSIYPGSTFPGSEFPGSTVIHTRWPSESGVFSTPATVNGSVLPSSSTFSTATGGLPNTNATESTSAISQSSFSGTQITASSASTTSASTSLLLSGSASTNIISTASSPSSNIEESTIQRSISLTSSAFISPTTSNDLPPSKSVVSAPNNTATESTFSPPNGTLRTPLPTNPSASSVSTAPVQTSGGLGNETSSLGTKSVPPGTGASSTGSGFSPSGTSPIVPSNSTISSGAAQPSGTGFPGNVCPANDGERYTTQGETYEIECFIHYPGPTLQGLRQSSIYACMDGCTIANHGFSEDRCFAVSYNPYQMDSAGNNCFFKTYTSSQHPVVDTQTVSARLLNATWMNSTTPFPSPSNSSTIGTSVTASAASMNSTGPSTILTAPTDSKGVASASSNLTSFSAGPSLQSTSSPSTHNLSTSATVRPTPSNAITSSASETSVTASLNSTTASSGITAAHSSSVRLLTSEGNSTSIGSTLTASLPSRTAATLSTNSTRLSSDPTPSSTVSATSFPSLSPSSSGNRTSYSSGTGTPPSFSGFSTQPQRNGTSSTASGEIGSSSSAWCRTWIRETSVVYSTSTVTSTETQISVQTQVPT